MKYILLAGFLFIKTSFAIDYSLNILDLPTEIMVIILGPLDSKVWDKLSRTSKKSYGLILHLKKITPSSIIMKDIFVDFNKKKMLWVREVLDTIKNTEERLNFIKNLQVKIYDSKDRKKIKNLLKKILLYSWSPTFLGHNGHNRVKDIAKTYKINLNKLKISRKDKILYAIYRDPKVYYSLLLFSAGCSVYPLYGFINEQMANQRELLIEAYANGYLSPSSYNDFFTKCPYETCSQICSSITRTIRFNCMRSCSPYNKDIWDLSNYTDYALLFPERCRFPELGDFNTKWPTYGEIEVGSNSTVAIPYIISHDCPAPRGNNCKDPSRYNVDVEYNIEIIKYNATYLAKNDSWPTWFAVIISGVYISCYTFLLFVPLCM